MVSYFYSELYNSNISFENEVFIYEILILFGKICESFLSLISRIIKYIIYKITANIAIVEYSEENLL